MEQLDYNLLYRWFVGLSPDDPVWDPTSFTKNRDRLQNGEVFAKFMTRLLNHSKGTSMSGFDRIEKRVVVPVRLLVITLLKLSVRTKRH